MHLFWDLFQGSSFLLQVFYLLQLAFTIWMAVDVYRGIHEDAIVLLEAILAVEPGYCQALHALAECRLATGEPTHAVTVLEKLIERDRRWSHYRAWRTLIQAHQARREPADALKACPEPEKQLP